MNPKRVYRITVCSVCGLEAPFECEHMAASNRDPKAPNVYTSLEVVPKAEVDRLRGLLTQTAHDLSEEGYSKWSSDLHEAINGAC